jgi:hypothetical protein
MTPENVDVLLAVLEENEHVEFKEAKGNSQFDKLVEYCVAMVNEGGGRIVLGVSDKPPRRVLVTQDREAQLGPGLPVVARGAGGRPYPCRRPECRDQTDAVRALLGVMLDETRRC